MGNEFFARKGLALGTASETATDNRILIYGADGVLKYRTDISGTGTSGTSGTRGTSGTSGIQGTSGTRGTSGTSGSQGPSSGLLYNFISSGTMADPGVSNFKLIRTSSFSNVTNIYINEIDNLSVIQTSYLFGIGVGDYIIIRGNDNSTTNFGILYVTSKTDVGSYWDFGVSVISGNWNLNSSYLCSISIQFSGTSGSQGTSGTSGVKGTSGTSGTSLLVAGVQNQIQINNGLGGLGQFGLMDSTRGSILINNSSPINTTGLDNTFIGHQSGCGNTTGFSNIFIGSLSGSNNITGFENIFIGTKSGCSNTFGDNNLFIGSNSGCSNTTGDWILFRCLYWCIINKFIYRCL